MSKEMITQRDSAGKVRRLLGLSAQNMNNLQVCWGRSYRWLTLSIPQLFARTVHQEMRSDTTTDWSVRDTQWIGLPDREITEAMRRLRERCNDRCIWTHEDEDLREAAMHNRLYQVRRNWLQIERRAKQRLYLTPLSVLL